MGWLDLLAGIPINAVLRIKVSILTAENAALKTENAVLKAENAALAAENLNLKQEIQHIKSAQRIHDEPIHSPSGPQGWMGR